MKYQKTLIVFFILFGTMVQAQEARDFITQYKFKLFEEKKIRPFSSVKLNLEITTSDGKFPATLVIMENMFYKLEMKGKNGNAVEYISPSEYKFLSIQAEKEKKHADASSDIHLRKKLWLNFYPFLHDKDDYPMRMWHEGILPPHLMPLTTENPAGSAEEFPGKKRFLQLLPSNEIFHIYHLDMKSMQIEKIETSYNDQGTLKTEVFEFKDYKKSPEGYTYPSIFTTSLGEAEVKNIVFNPKLNQKDTEVDF